MRHFTKAGDGPYKDIKLVKRSSIVRDKSGEVLRKMDDIEVPEFWSQTATDMLAQKYLRKAGVPSKVERIYEDCLPSWLAPSTPSAGATFGSETSVVQTINRLAGHWTYSAWQQGYFRGTSLETEQLASTFFDEIRYMLVHQMAAPNSPQWFNTGLWWAYGITGENSGTIRAEQSADGVWHVEEIAHSYRYPQVHACFIQGVEDDLISERGIFGLWTREARVFKFGGGSGSNFSNLRGSGEPLSGGGSSSGLLSFLKIGDRAAGSIKSGGTTRRAAKIVVVDDDHPDVIPFIRWKAGEEQKVAAMICGHDNLNRHMIAIVANGESAIPAAKQAMVPDSYIKKALDMRDNGVVWQMPELGIDYEGEAYGTVSGQNANNSVSVTNKFMNAVENDEWWGLKGRLDKKAGVERYRTKLKARELFREINEASWFSADPGLIFRDTMNAWNTCPVDGDIEATNPCQPATATVLCPDGIRTIADIDVGSTIWSGSQWAKVVRKIDTGTKEVFRYRTRAGDFVGTANHQVFQNAMRVEAGDAESIDSCIGAAPDGRPDDLDPQDVLAGLMVGDGYINVSNGGANLYPLLCVGENDQSYFADEGLAQLIGHKPFDGTKHRVRCELTREELPPLPVRTIPDRYFRGDAKKIRGFLRGLYSANGCVTGNRVALKTTSRELCAQVQALLSSLGIASYHTVNRASVVEFANGQYECKQSYDVNITAGKPIFASLVGFIQPYKAEKLAVAVEASGPIRKRSYEIVEVERLGEMPVWDITVDVSEHSYWTGGLLVSNCGEYCFLNDTGCNLASINLLKFICPYGTFDHDSFSHAVRIWTTVLDVTVGMASYPSASIAIGSEKYRTLGLGYANLGALLMSMGLPYDSDLGRMMATKVTSLMTARAYETSSWLAETLGTFPRYDANKKHVLRVIRSHAMCAGAYNWNREGTEWPAAYTPETLYPTGDFADVVIQAWVDACEAATEFGVRNAQVTLIAPTGTISLVMDCDTTGVEPDFAVVKFKKLAGGGYVKIVNQRVDAALEVLGYSQSAIDSIVAYMVGQGTIVGSPHGFEMTCNEHGISDDVEEMASSSMDMRHLIADWQGEEWGYTDKQWNDINNFVCGTMTIEGAPYLRDRHLPVFDCANKCGRTGTRFIAPLGHIKMMACLTPLLSGSISKTVNLPESATVSDFDFVHTTSWKMGIKDVSCYRDTCKLNQPLSSSFKFDVQDTVAETILKVVETIDKGSRKFLPDRRTGFTQKVRIDNHKIYLRTGEYKDGSLGEIFIDMAKSGSQLRSWANSFAMAVSIGLQHGVPLERFVESFVFTKFEPNGMVMGHERIRMCTSVIDMIFRELGITYLGRDDLAHISHREVADEGVALTATHNEPEGSESLPGVKLGLDSRTSSDVISAVNVARMKGYEGEACHNCHQMTLVRSGVCLRCDTCGSTTGCS